MIKPRGLILIALLALAAGAQDRNTNPVPQWPVDGRIPPEESDRFVFLTPDKHTIVVLVPEGSEAGINGPKRIVKVPLMNNLAPFVSASIRVEPSGVLSYRYVIGNGAQAEDAIGAWSLIIPPVDPSLRVTHVSHDNEQRWGGAPAFVAVASRSLFPDEPPGRYLTWFHQGNSLIPPGKKLDGFRLESSYRPGLTTAWFSSGKLVKFDQSWPKVVFQQLLLLEDRKWRQKNVPTIGPMFPPDTPVERIVASFLKGMDHMLQTGWINSSSPFTGEVINMLHALRQSTHSGKCRVLTARPGTRTEMAIATALRVSLDIGLRQ